MNCAYCKKEFEDYELDLSHDIPKYLGGTDKDGRHYLCKEHHILYEMKILNACLKYVGEEPTSENEMIVWMKEFKVADNYLKARLREVAQKVKEEFYGLGNLY